MHKSIPEHGRKKGDILAELSEFAKDDPSYKDGRTWSLVYYLNEEHQQFLANSYQTFSSANGLNPNAFKSLKRFETEIISATADLLNGPDTTCGVVTSGGTESCLMAVKTYRDMAKKQRRVKKPEMILPTTAHVAWFKASEYFNVKVRLLPLDENLAPDISKLKKLINRNTVMILGSAPEYPHGTIDPIQAMSEIALQHRIPMHVDACVGGFILPFMAMNGETIPQWDYRNPGVTSISADIHKYGFAAKGASTITYRSLDYLKHQMFVQQDWPGGVFASPALLGTRPGGAYSAAWATLQYFGKEGYQALARDTSKAVSEIKKGIESIQELYVMGNPIGPLLGYGSTSKTVNIFAVGDQMDKRGWQVNRLQQPDGLHCMVTANHLQATEQYIADLQECVEVVKANPELATQGGAATYGMMSHIPLRGMVKQKVLDIFSSMYQAGGAEMDLSSASENMDNSDPNGSKPGLIDRLALWYVKRRS
jgi:glutamate/tyrosine decarboxylase-like PLP-dependent enzyme